MKTKTKIRKTNKAVQTFIKQTFKNFKTMKTKIKITWLGFMCLAITTTALHSCNVTRVVTNESQYFQRGDTSVLIQTKTTETYDASKKL